MPLPTGMVTFLFTDIEGSTQRWDRHHEAMRVAVERHDAILRGAIERHGGYVFKTVGDAFCAAFDSASDAVAAAIDGQRELTRAAFADVDGLRVRMGIHAGETHERDGDYFGPDVNRTARLMSVGHGGQLLVSGAVESLIRQTLPAEVALVDLGLRRLKDLTHPERIWQVNADGLRTDFPPLDSLDARPNNLPVQANQLFGRERDILTLKDMLREHRLVTIAGSGGVGKTRTALQIGADLIDQFPDGVWFADLSPIREGALVPTVVAQTLGIDQVASKPVDTLITERLQRKHLLLVIDNCEHVIDDATALIDAVLRQTLKVHVVATSRQPLGADGEAIYRLPSLTVPDADARPNAVDALQYGSIAVFVDRAKRAATGLTWDDDAVPAVADICRRLDGIPLAIELAAARVNVLSTRNLARRLDERFTLLTRGRRTALPRQQTLAALIDWSYDLLTASEQLLFARLSIFAGSFTVDAATSVCGGDGLEETDVFDIVASLADKSLITADTSGDETRFRLLESTRAYGARKLEAAGERESLSRRHAAYFCDSARAANARYGIGSTFRWLAGLRADMDNYRAALEWCIGQRNDDLMGGEIAGLLNRLWRSSGLVLEGRHWIELALERLSERDHPHIVARLWRGLAHLLSAKAKVDAATHAMRLYDALGDDRGRAWSQASMSYGLVHLGRIDEAADVIAQALDSFLKVGDRVGIASSHQQQSTIADLRGDDAQARALLETSLADFRTLQNESGIALALGNLGELEFKEGRAAEAIRVASEALQLHQLGGDKFNSALTALNLGAYRIAAGDVGGGQAAASWALTLARDLQYFGFVAFAMQHLALALALQGDAETAARLLGYVDAQLQAIGIKRELTEDWSCRKLTELLAGALTGAQRERLAAEGAEWTEDRAVEEATRRPAPAVRSA